ncbi:ABC-type transport auxiliary lipoprotein family protein [Trinickia mobilis]|uniref:ABC-type transport auxiliary lipoprotein family protein n=1 Tax=Trinickia mobilis TaxID=2816356 RepID=UPI001A909442
MSRSTDRSFFFPPQLIGAFATIVLTAGMLAGCALGTPAAVANIRYDLGPANPATSPGPLPPFKVLDVSAPQTLNSDGLIYRLSYADSQRTATYATSHWTMPPAQLLTQRLRAALSSHGTVLTGGDGVHAPVLKVDLDEFEQVFDGESESHGALTARATLMLDGKVLGQRTFVARAPSSTPDAAGGARALAAASDDFVSQLVVWLGMTPIVAVK